VCTIPGLFLCEEVDLPPHLTQPALLLEPVLEKRGGPQTDEDAIDESISKMTGDFTGAFSNKVVITSNKRVGSTFKTKEHFLYY
jgi:hypothetical protein